MEAKSCNKHQGNPENPCVNPAAQLQDIDLVEFFAGQASVSKAARASGKDVASVTFSANYYRGGWILDIGCWKASHDMSRCWFGFCLIHAMTMQNAS